MMSTEKEADAPKDAGHSDPLAKPKVAPASPVVTYHLMSLQRSGDFYRCDRCGLTVGLAVALRVPELAKRPSKGKLYEFHVPTLNQATRVALMTTVQPSTRYLIPCRSSKELQDGMELKPWRKAA